ncbi:MAG: hypothetical protein R3E10_15105 [Gemmatimonadota bacterium]
MYTHFKHGLLALAFVILASAATSGQLAAQSTTQPPDSVMLRRKTAQVQVDNHNWLDMHIYLVRDGILWPLGVVTGLNHDTFELPSLATLAGADLRLLADPIGGSGAYVSQSLVINPGDRVQMAIENNLDLSTTSVMAGERASR